MKFTIHDLAEAQGRAYARALLDAERLRAMSLSRFASEHGITDPDEPGVRWTWDYSKNCWRCHTGGADWPCREMTEPNMGERRTGQ